MPGLRSFARGAAARTGDEPAAADAELGLPPASLHAELPPELGDSFSVKFLGFERPMVMISDPAAIKALYTEREHGLPPGRNVFLEPILGSRSLLLLEGADHLAHRKLMLPAFHGERMRSYEPIVEEIVDAEIDSWPLGEEFAAPPADAGDHPRGDPARRLRRRRGPAAASGCAACSRDLLAETASPATQLRALAHAAASAAAARWARFEDQPAARSTSCSTPRSPSTARGTTSRSATTSSRR